jgi:hypothetical protein
MLCKFFLCWCHKYLWIKFFAFGDMNSAQRHWTNSLHEHNIVLWIWNVCILHVKDWLMKKKTKHCSLTIIRARLLKCNGLFIESFRKHKLSKNKIQRLDPTIGPCFYLLFTLVGLPFVTTCGIHYEIIVKYFNPLLTFFPPNYFWSI